MKRAIVLILIILMALPLGIQVSAAEESHPWQEESVYRIQVDRFMNGTNENDQTVSPEDPEAYHGGDLQGVIDQLGYIKELGFTAIELSPIVSNSEDGAHGFAVDDFRAVEERFGTMEKAKELVEEAHSKDLKVILDFPISYASNEHPWMEDESKDGWFLNEEEWVPTNVWQEGLPELDTSVPDVRKYLVDAASFWVNETGVDGLRLAASPNVDTAFYQSMAKEVQSPDFFLFSNTKPDPETVTEGYLDGFSDQRYQQEIRKSFAQFDRPLNELYSLYEQNEELYSEGVPVHAIDDGTDARFTHLAVKEGQNPVTRWKLALTYLFTSPGVPVMNYGTEVPLDDGGTLGDIRMMNFKMSDEQIEERIENLTSMRKQFKALTHGDYQLLHKEDGFAVFKRTYGGESVVVAVNNSSETKVMKMENMEEGQQLRGLLQDGMVRQQKDGTYRLGMERETADVFIVEEDTGYNWLFIGFVGGVLSLFVIGVTAVSIKNRKE
ncbi:alpha-amylase family glycosyl hydrolase [Halobacillus salinus]|uniref:alpha-amylase family glycosyl hydrolase n=1 Tax=Halobacillus salinus TaxID=192814 RepID=UPI001590C36C|nr:alpha-amylase family glycosyl hydrolase [Halobacillus salinus]